MCSGGSQFYKISAFNRTNNSQAHVCGLSQCENVNEQQRSFLFKLKDAECPRKDMFYIAPKIPESRSLSEIFLYAQN